MRLLFLLLILLSGCRTISDIVSDIKSIDSKLDDLNQEKDRVEGEKHSKASAQVVAANRTLKADPDPSRFVQAASPALDVAQSALPTPSSTDLLEAMDIQAKFLAGQVSEAHAELNKVRSTIAEKDRQLVDLQSGIQKLAKEKEQTVADLERQVRIIDEDNRWYNTINPFHGLWGGVKRLLGWVLAFVVLGGLLRVGSIFFPQLEIIRWIGRIIVFPFKLILTWIPDAFRALGAVPHKDFQREKDIADRTVGAIQEFKDANKEAYAATLRGNLIDWMKDRTELQEHIDKKVVELNLR